MTAPKSASSELLPNLNLVYRGKVRDIYAPEKQLEMVEVTEDVLLMIATDRISAFDCILPTPVPHKGEVLTQLSAFWFRMLQPVIDNHLITINTDDMPPPVSERPDLVGRTMLVRRTEVFPVECVVRGYLEGSGLKDYQATGTICGHKLPSGLQQCDRLPEPIFTPATKARTGHDENISYEQFAEIVGEKDAAFLRDTSLAIYQKASEYAASRGIIIADTKFEFGRDAEGNILLIDEVLTPDSSRFWSAARYSPGRAQPSFDKQFVREYLETLDWDKRPPAPPLPSHVARATTERYLEAFRLLTGNVLEV